MPILLIIPHTVSNVNNFSKVIKNFNNHFYPLNKKSAHSQGKGRYRLFIFVSSSENQEQEAEYKTARANRQCIKVKIIPDKVDDV